MHDQYFQTVSFQFWNFFLDEVKEKVSFKVHVSSTVATDLNLLVNLTSYNIEFDDFLITQPFERNIKIDAFRANKPIAYFAYIIMEAEKNEAIISLDVIKNTYIFNFDFLT